MNAAAFCLSDTIIGSRLINKSNFNVL